MPEVFADCQPLSFSEPFWRNAQETASAAPGNPISVPGVTAVPAPVALSPEGRINEAIARVDRALPLEFEKHYSTSLGNDPIETIQTVWRRRDWRKLTTAGERAELSIALRAAEVCNFSFDANDPRLMVFQWQMPFYKDCRLLRIIDQRGPRSRFAHLVLHDPSHDLCSLHKESPPIHHFNKRRAERGELRINDGTVAAYLRFFGEFVQAEDGAFPIIESGGDLHWLAQGPVAHDEGERRVALRSAFDAAIAPVVIYRLPALTEPSGARPQAGTETSVGSSPATTPASPMACRAFVGYGRHVFVAGFFVKQDGGVDMFEDAPAALGELPIEPISFNVEFQFALRTSPGGPGHSSGGH